MRKLGQVVPPPHKRKRRTAFVRLLVLSALLSNVPAGAQTPGKAPSLQMAAVPLVSAQRTQQTMVDLNFRVPPGYHVNSNTPKSEFLIPTALRMEVPTDIILGKIEYPAGADMTFPFSPDEKLSVYSGDFTIAGEQDTLVKGILLLAVYSLGLAVPSLLTSLLMERFLKFYSRFRSHMHALEVASGALLIGLGVLLVIGRFTLISNWLSFLNRFAL